MKNNELTWVEFLRRKVPCGPGVIQGIGDDCAFVSVRDKKILLKSDLFVENVHFRRKNTDCKTIGMRAVARVLSDFAACGGSPQYIGISTGLPRRFSEKDLKAILSGVLTMSKKYGFSLVGGDTGRTPVLMLDVWGVGETDKFIRRNGAQIGDYVFVTGPLGARKFNAAFQPRIKEARELSRQFKVNAMIDISDGFALDLHRIARASDKGVLLYGEKLPVTRGESDLYRGEDYELIFTVDKSEKNLRALKKRFFFVGVITHRRAGCVVLRGKKITPLAIKGYTHF